MEQSAAISEGPVPRDKSGDTATIDNSVFTARGLSGDISISASDVLAS